MKQRTYHSLRHGLTDTGAATSTEEDLALEYIILKDGSRIYRWRFDIGLGHGW